jgi:hypothetical protein
MHAWMAALASIAPCAVGAACLQGRRIPQEDELAWSRPSRATITPQ